VKALNLGDFAMSGILFKRSAARNYFAAKFFATRNFCSALVLITASLFSGHLFAQGAALGCGVDFYQTRSGGSAVDPPIGTSLLRFTAANLSGGGMATNVWGVVDSDQINAIGLNPLSTDSFIYGLIASGTTARLAKLGTTGAVDVGPIITDGTTAGVTGTTALPGTPAVSFTPTAGVFDAIGRYYFAGQNGGISPPAIYRIDNLVPNGSGNIIVAQVYTLSATLVNIGDFAFGPDGNLYGATGTTLVQLALAGNAATVTTKTITSVGGVGSAFFNNAAEFFVYENGTGKLTQVLFSFGAAFASGAATTSAPVVITGTGSLPGTTASSDGASCITFNADLTVTKTNGTTTPLPSGSTTTYTIRVTNNGPSLAAGAIFGDTAVTGLNKTAVACSAAVGNQCITPPTIAQLQSGTFTLPTLTATQFYEITVTATVTATGI
jgi:uncharacterized repeat protein (TIGR01451 family)